MTTDLELSGNSGHYIYQQNSSTNAFYSIDFTYIYIIFTYVYSFDLFLKTYNFYRLWFYLIEELVQQILFKLKLILTKPDLSF